MPEVKAKGKYIRIAPRKARLVANLVRGKDVEEALALLQVTNKKAAPIIAKIIKSAVANAIERGGIDIDNLYVKRIFVDDGPRLKRFQPSYGGRVNLRLKRYSHITVVLDERL